MQQYEEINIQRNRKVGGSYSGQSCTDDETDIQVCLVFIDRKLPTFNITFTERVQGCDSPAAHLKEHGSSLWLSRVFSLQHTQSTWLMPNRSCTFNYRIFQLIFNYEYCF